MKEIEIPFGAKDSELKGWEYTIPEGMEAEIKDGKIVVREKESEDERIRKAIINYILYETKGNISEATEHVWVTWLEKQKEQKPLSTEETELNSLAFLSQMGYTCIPPKKEHQNNSDAPKNALGGALNSPLDKDKNLDDIAQDYVEAVKEYNPEPTWDLMQTAVCYGYHYREEEEQKEQKPEGVQGDKGDPGLPGIEAVEGVVHHVMNTHYIVTNQKQLNARLREIPEGTKVSIFICKAKED